MSEPVRAMDPGPGLTPKRRAWLATVLETPGFPRDFAAELRKIHERIAFDLARSYIATSARYCREYDTNDPVVAESRARNAWATMQARKSAAADKARDMRRQIEERERQQPRRGY